MTRPTMSGRPPLSCVACHSSVIVPALPTWVDVPDRWEAVGSWADVGDASSKSEQASDAPKAARVLMWTPSRPLEVFDGGKSSPPKAQSREKGPSPGAGRGGMRPAMRRGGGVDAGGE